MTTQPTTALAPPTALRLPTSADDGPGPLRWTREDYYRLAEAGVFQDRHVELIDGEIIGLSPQNLPHVSAAFRVPLALHRAFGDAYHFRVQANLRIGNSDPEPDFAVVRRGDVLPDSAPTTAVLVVEVSASSLAYDRDIKASLYASAGIPDYWIVNAQNNTLEVRRGPVVDDAGRFGFRYSELTTYAADQTVSPLELPDKTVVVIDLLPESFGKTAP